MKVHIIGGSGAGKTYISSKLGEKYGLEVIDLDKIEWVNINNVTKKRPLKDKDKLLKKELEKNNYIIEGVYYKWCDPSFNNSDYIFYLKSPLWLQQFRIIRRSLRRKLGLEKSYVKETFKSVMELLRWNIKYNCKLKKDIFNMLEKYKTKLYNVSSYKEVIKILGGEQ